MKIGVLSLQGDFAEHQSILDILNVASALVRTSEDLKQVDALIIPGGESTVMMKLLIESGLDTAIINRVQSGMPVFGTCAGAIVLSDSSLGLIDVTLERNAYGSQKHSFSAEITSEVFGEVRASFIRAPKIVRVGESVNILAEHEGAPVLAVSGNIFISTFHTEIRNDLTLHKFFLSPHFLSTELVQNCGKVQQ